MTSTCLAYDATISIQKMVGKKKKYPFCRDMLNSLEKIDKQFLLSRAYHWYSDLHANDVSSKFLRTTGLVNVGCMPEVFGVPEIMLWCSKHFDASRGVNQVGNNNIQRISLNPLVFHIMLRLANPNKEFKIAKADDFITNHVSPKRLLPYFKDSLSRLQTSSF